MSTTAAFFDLDRTLIRGSASFPLAVACFKEGMVTPRELLSDARTLVSFIRHGSSDESSQAVRERVLRAVKDHPQSQLTAMADDFVPALALKVLPEARLLLADHATRGDDRIIVSASPQEIVQRLADQLGLEGAVGSRGEVGPDGKYTGRLVGEFCYGLGKVTEVRRLADERGYDLSQCTAYSDSISDLAFLECVGNPVAVNPDTELRVLAGQRGWPIVEVEPDTWSRRLARLQRLPTYVRRSLTGRR